MARYRVTHGTHKHRDEQGVLRTYGEGCEDGRVVECDDDLTKLFPYKFERVEKVLKRHVREVVEEEIEEEDVTVAKDDAPEDEAPEPLKVKKRKKRRLVKE